MTRIKIKLIKNGRLPQKKLDGDACYDCYARIDNERSVIIPCFGISQALLFDSMNNRNKAYKKLTEMGIETVIIL